MSFIIMLYQDKIYAVVTKYQTANQKSQDIDKVKSCILKKIFSLSRQKTISVLFSCRKT